MKLLLRSMDASSTVVAPALAPEALADVGAGSDTETADLTLLRGLRASNYECGIDPILEQSGI